MTGAGVARLLAASLAVVLIALVAGCGEDEPTTETFEDPSAIEVDGGAEFAIALDSNPTTGYEWRVAGKPDESIFEFVGSEYEQDPGSEGLDGAGGTQTLTFRATGAGEATIELEYVFSGGDKETATKRDIALTVK
jgi:inhibitor of cysteine peptidase